MWSRSEDFLPVNCLNRPRMGMENENISVNFVGRMAIWGISMVNTRLMTLTLQHPDYHLPRTGQRMCHYRPAPCFFFFSTCCKTPSLSGCTLSRPRPHSRALTHHRIWVGHQAWAEVLYIYCAFLASPSDTGPRLSRMPLLFHPTYRTVPCLVFPASPTGCGKQGLATLCIISARSRLSPLSEAGPPSQQLVVCCWNPLLWPFHCPPRQRQTSAPSG